MENIIEKNAQISDSINRFNLPESFEESFENFNLPSSLANTLVLSDVHIPYHNIQAVEEALNYGIAKNIDSILLNGDIIDCFMLSKFNPDPTKRHLSEEIIAFQQFIRSLKTVFDVPIYYKLGNHEERYEKIMISRCAEFLGIPYFDFENVLGCTELGITVIKDQRTVYAGKLPVYHGHEVGLKSVAVNPARSLFLKIHASGACSHLHRSSSHTEPSINDDITTYSFGHLGEAHPKYARVNKWNWGCGRIEKNEDGDYEVINVNLTQNKLFALR